MLYRIDDVVNDIFAFADHERVNERVHGLGVHGGMSTRDDDGVGLVTFYGADGNPRKVEHVERVGVERLIGQGKGNEVEAD